MVSIGGAATENSSDSELIVSFGVCLVCPLPAQVCIVDLEIHPHLFVESKKIQAELIQSVVSLLRSRDSVGRESAM
jgi:hypothetical protein